MKIFAALEDDISAGVVWLEKSGLPPRCVVKVTNTATSQSVFCEALQFEQNFLTNYNQSPRYTITDPKSSIVIAGWYRTRLGGLETQKDYPLNVIAADSCWGKLRACLDHPQIVVRVAAWLGIVSVVLGGIGVLLGALSMWPKC